MLPCYAYNVARRGTIVAPDCKEYRVNNDRDACNTFYVWHSYTQVYAKYLQGLT